MLPTAVATMTSSNIEEWRTIPGYDDRYLVSNLGHIIGPRGSNKPFKSRDGYMIATLYNYGNKIRKGVHVLVGLAFIPNPEEKPEINHKNGIRNDNRVENLEWVTRSENNLHRRRVLKGGGGRLPKPVVCIDTGTVYPSLTEAAKNTGARLEKILACCKGKRKSTHGLRWAYAEEEKTVCAS